MLMTCALLPIHVMAMDTNRKTRDNEKCTQKLRLLWAAAIGVAAATATQTYYTHCTTCPCLPVGTVVNETTPVCITPSGLMPSIDVELYNQETMKVPREKKFGYHCALITDYKQKSWWRW
jgi:hypothetical protein